MRKGHLGSFLWPATGHRWKRRDREDFTASVNVCGEIEASLCVGSEAAARHAFRQKEESFMTSKTYDIITVGGGLGGAAWPRRWPNMGTGAGSRARDSSSRIECGESSWHPGVWPKHGNSVSTTSYGTLVDKIYPGLTNILEWCEESAGTLPPRPRSICQLSPFTILQCKKCYCKLLVRQEQRSAEVLTCAT